VNAKKFDKSNYNKVRLFKLENGLKNNDNNIMSVTKSMNTFGQDFNAQIFVCICMVLLDNSMTVCSYL